MTKVCTQCGEEKDESEFPPKRGGRAAGCKECKRKQQREYYERNKDEISKKNKEWYENNKEKALERGKKWRENNREHINKRERERIQNNPEERERRRAACRKWRNNNIEYAREKAREWRNENTELAREMSREYMKNRYATDLDFRLYDSIRCMIRRILLSGGSSKAEEIVGYTVEQLKSRIEFNFEPGMSWDNYGEWEIDHQIPIDHFKKKGETRPEVINALSNLRPMWMGENRSKNNKFYKI